MSASAELAPANDGSGDWLITERGEDSHRAPFDQFRASVLWKADVYLSEEERCRVEQDVLSLEGVARIFDEDLAERDDELRFELDQLDGPECLRTTAPSRDSTPRIR